MLQIDKFVINFKFRILTFLDIFEVFHENFPAPLLAHLIFNEFCGLALK